VAGSEMLLRIVKRFEYESGRREPLSARRSVASGSYVTRSVSLIAPMGAARPAAGRERHVPR